MSGYDDFIKGKTRTPAPDGIDADVSKYGLFDFQEDIVKWALKKARAAIFADTGLGKTRMQLAWANEVHKHCGKPLIMVAPLAVCQQTISEGREIGVSVEYARDGECVGDGIYITNYERLDKFDLSLFCGVVLDESSSIKHFDSKRTSLIVSSFHDTLFRLACSATPSPNDWVELGNHSEFLGLMDVQGMLTRFFFHDSGDTKSWMIKGHAKDEFWRWVSTWGMMVKSPSDLGYDGSRYVLPALNEYDVPVSGYGVDDGELFARKALTMSEYRRVKRESLGDRVDKAVELCDSLPKPVVIWCDLNDESSALVSAIDGAEEIRGSMSPEEKADVMNRFSAGEIDVLVTKSSMTGMGLNWQHCNNTIFVGLNYSYELYYQAVRRMWRFGQSKPVNVYRIYADANSMVLDILNDKAAKMEDMFRELSRVCAKFSRTALHENYGHIVSEHKDMEMPSWIQ